MIKTIFTDCIETEEKILEQIKANEELKSILNNLENDEKEYNVCLDLSEGTDYSAMMWVTRNEEGKFTIVEGIKHF